MLHKSLKINSISKATVVLLERLGNDIRLATPLGLGKPNQLLNAIYKSVEADKNKKLKIFTALSLQIPSPPEELAQKFLKPFAKRHWGENYPDLCYAVEATQNKLASNIEVHEFYFQAGIALKSPQLQRHYQSLNYTHVAQNIFKNDINVIVQLVAARDGKISLSCNPDVTLDISDLYEQDQKKVLKVAVIHPDLPFLTGDAEVSEDFFDIIVESPEVNHQLFALPRQPMDKEDHLIGLYASQWVKDDGTIQIGIGSLSDAVVSALCLRQKENAAYVRLIKVLQPVPEANHSVLSSGLYGLTEMLTDGFMHLRNAGILKREVHDKNSGQKTYLHGGFILGSKALYNWLRTLSEKDSAGLRMTRVSQINDLYDPNETLLRTQRKHPRFFNSTMQVSLLGECMSETLPNGNVVSGVGGQYNFVSMAHELKDSRSVIMLRSTRVNADGKRVSNIVWEPGHATIPRHLRDLVVTEYGTADLKGKSDEECIQALLNITDSAFQSELLEKAKHAKKIAADYEIPTPFRQNTTQSIKNLARRDELKPHLLPFPFGSDFTKEEEHLSVALMQLSSDLKSSKLKVLKKTLLKKNAEVQFAAELKRMDLAAPKNLKNFIYKKLVLAYLQNS